MPEQNPPAPPPYLPPSLTRLDGVQIKHLFAASTAWLERNAPFINSLNVFPVPDGDSGTNMLLTMRSALHEIEISPSHSVGEICAGLARGALLGSRGNSGVILSQIIRGFASSVETKPEITAADLAAGLGEASRLAYKAVGKPVEGTILTVIRESAEAAHTAAAQTSDIRIVLDQTVQAARASVANTPNLLPILKKAGVVDAGGQGLFVILEGANKYLKGEVIESVATSTGPENLVSLNREEGWGYDIQFHIRGRGLNLDAIRDTISSMGESALIVGDPSLIKVHVHAPNPGDIVKYGAEQGALVNVIIENMQEQYVDFVAGGTADRRSGAENLGGLAGTSPDEIPAISTIAVASGAGLCDVFTSLGAGGIIRGGQSNNPSTQEILDAIQSAASTQVIVLPNNKNVIFAANQACTLSSKQVQVIPTRTAPQGISALLAFNYQADLDTNARAMEQAAGRVRTLEVTIATRSVEIDNVRVKEGQAIGLIDGDLAGAGTDRLALIVELLEKMGTRSAEIITVFYGEGATPSEADALVACVGPAFPGQTVELHAGGQPVYQFIISVE